MTKNSISEKTFLPALLLLSFGLLVGIIIALVKEMAALGVSAACFAFIQATGSGLVILALCAFRNIPLRLDKACLRYYVIAGLSGIALPNQLLFLAVPHLGAGLTSLVYCFPPLATLVLAMALGMEKANPWRITGLSLGFVSTLLIALPEDGIKADILWLGIAMLAPLCLAFGNVYRSHAWPESAHPMCLAAGMLLFGALWLVPLLPFSHPEALLQIKLFFPLLIVIALNAAAYIVFLYLQQIAGPVYLGQVGYVNAICGIMIGVVVLGERYSNWVWLAALGVFSGILLTNIPLILQKRKDKDHEPNNT